MQTCSRVPLYLYLFFKTYHLAYNIKILEQDRAETAADAAADAAATEAQEEWELLDQEGEGEEGQEGGEGVGVRAGNGEGGAVFAHGAHRGRVAEPRADAESCRRCRRHGGLDARAKD